MKAIRTTLAVVLFFVGIGTGAFLGAMIASEVVGVEAMKHNPIVRIVFSGLGIAVVAFPFLYVIGKILPDVDSDSDAPEKGSSDSGKQE